VGRALDAQHLSLFRFDHATGTARLIGAVGQRVLLLGAQLPIDRSVLLAAASRGRIGTLDVGNGALPVEVLQLSAGLRSGCSMPLPSRGVPAGALVAMWRAHHTNLPQAMPLGEDEAPLVSALGAVRTHGVRVLVCHESRIVAGGIGRMAEEALGAETDVCLSLDEAKELVADRKPDLIVCGDRVNPAAPIATIREQLLEAGAAAPLLLLATSDTTTSLLDAYEMGAMGYVPWSRASESLLDGMLALLEGHAAIPPKPDPRQSQIRLTRREREVLLHVNDGLSDKEIAIKLDVRLSTVKTHARSLFEKLGAHSRTDALRVAREHGLV
jgi:DNA-binding NarL/FixJ family response regulator